MQKIQLLPIFLVFLIFPLSVKAEPIQCALLPQIFMVYFKTHYAVKELSEEVKKHTADQYIKQIDPSKTLLMDSDVVQLKKDLPKVFDTVKTNDCAILDATNALLLKRAEESEKFVKATVTDSFKLDTTVELQIEPDKRSFPKTTEERDALWKKMIHFQMANHELAQTKAPEARKQLIHRYELLTKRMRERKLE